MSKKWRMLFCFLILTAFLSGCVCMECENLTVNGGKRVVYEGENAGRFVATYYSLSDDSLNFVKVTMPDGEQYTLPQVVSGSGARYTLDRELVWWVKGDSVLVQTRDENGEWQIKYTLEAIKE